MYWTAEQEFVQPVTLSWVRKARSLTDTWAGEVEEERFTLLGATWRQREGTHFLVYDNPEPDASGDPVGQASPASSGSSGRTTLRLEPDQLTLIRFGDVTWNHTFRVGVTAVSVIRMASAHLDVEIETETLAIRVNERGGEVQCDYTLRLAGVPQQVSLAIRFVAVQGGV